MGNMWVRRHELLRLAERVKRLETQVDGLWTTVIAMDKRFAAFLKETGWSDNGDLTQVIVGRRPSISDEPTQEHTKTETGDADVKQGLSEGGTGRWLLETPP